jgi:hypothetical protein
LSDRSFRILTDTPRIDQFEWGLGRSPFGSTRSHAGRHNQAMARFLIGVCLLFAGPIGCGEAVSGHRVVRPHSESNEKTPDRDAVTVPPKAIPTH